MVENYRTQAGWQSWPRNMHFLVMRTVCIFFYLSVGCIKSVCTGCWWRHFRECPVPKPEQYLSVRRFRRFYTGIQKSWINTETSEPMYVFKGFQAWIEEMEDKGKDELVTFVSQECRLFTPVLVTSLRSRMQLIWQYLQTMELIDPLGPMDKYVTTAV